MYAFKKGFTLIEVITVISVIIILGSLVSYVAVQGNRKQYKLVCAKNLKDLHIKTMLYLQDNPKLPDVTNVDDKQIFYLLEDGLTNTSSLAASDILTCPAQKIKNHSVYTIWGPTVERINSGNSSTDNNSESTYNTILFIDQYINSHQNFSLGIMNSGKAVQYFTKDSIATSNIIHPSESTGLEGNQTEAFATDMKDGSIGLDSSNKILGIGYDGEGRFNWQ